MIKSSLRVERTTNLESLRDAWIILAAQPNATIFQSWEWISLSAKHGLQTGDQLVLSIHDGDEIVGIAPLLLQRKRGKLTKVTPMGGGDYLDILAMPHYQPAVAEAVVNHLSTELRKWDIGDFRSAHPAGVFASFAVNDRPEINPKILSATIPHQQYPYARLPQSWSAYEVHLGKKLRWQLGYDLRRMQRDFELVTLRMATAETLQDDMSALFHLHQERWTAKGKAGAFASIEVQSFHKELAEALLPSGRIRLYTLRLNGEPAAALQCFVSGKSVCYYQGGFRAQFSQHSPAKTLIAQAIKDAIAGGAEEFDFLKGEEDYKRRWATDNRQTIRIVIARKRLLPWLSLNALTLQPVLKTLARSRLRKQP